MQLGLLIFMAFGKDLNSSYYLNRSFKNTFVSTGTPLSFGELQSVDNWWTWMETDFLDKLYWDTWYNGQPTDFDNVSVE